MARGLHSSHENCSKPSHMTAQFSWAIAKVFLICLRKEQANSYSLSHMFELSILLILFVLDDYYLHIRCLPLTFTTDLLNAVELRDICRILETLGCLVLWISFPCFLRPKQSAKQLWMEHLLGSPKVGLYSQMEFHASIEHRMLLWKQQSNENEKKRMNLMWDLTPELPINAPDFVLKRFHVQFLLFIPQS